MDEICCLKFIKNKTEITNCVNTLNVDVQETFKNCCSFCFDRNREFADVWKLKIDSVVDFLQDELNTGHWSEVPIDTRRAFTAASFVKANIILKDRNEESKTIVTDALKCVDLGLLLGAPLDDNDDLLNQSASHLSGYLHETSPTGIQIERKRKAESPCSENYLKIKAEQIVTLDCPSLEHFSNNYYLPQVPVKLKGCITHWPANTKWLDVDYLLKVAGNRTVPIELGSHYTESNWTQKLMSLKDFIRNHYLESNEQIGYLAQHNLFDQILELKDDICVPDYCALSRNYDNSEPPDINAWFGPKGTLSPLHYDPKDNLLAQVFGVKQIVLFAPRDSPNLYPHDDKLLFNTAQVDPLNPNLTKYPQFCNAEPFKCLLEEGEMLYIPQKWWHHVTALDKSFSVSFWWQ